MDELLGVLKHAILDTLRGECWGEALPMLEEWCERFPEDTRSWLNRGYCLVRLGRYQETVAAFNRCLELDPNLKKARKRRDRVVTEPLLFLKPKSAVIGNGSKIVLPELSHQVEHEAELALVIGRRCRSIAPERF